MDVDAEYGALVRVTALLLPLLALAVAGAASVPKIRSAAFAPEPPRAIVLSPAATKAVQGRARGLPAECIDQARPIAVRIIDRGAILWEITPRRWFVNVVPACPTLAADRILSTYTGPSNRICRGDLVRVLGSPDGRQRGTCRLGPFLPYTR